MNFDTSTVEEWFFKKGVTDFPEGFDYVTKYKSIKAAIEGLLADATRGADAWDKTSLTWHDSNHINTVIKRATKLLSYEKCDLTPYEIYYLLVAIQIHDLGNIKGRKDHEARAIEILDSVFINPDSTERNIINDIVETHSGEIAGNKDKISFIKEETLHHDPIRTQFIAAILRFADELADEPKRASISLLKAEKLEKESEIHHLYAHCLTTTYIPPNSKIINLNFTIDKDFCKKKYGKFDKVSQSLTEIYLLEEIFNRTLKVHIEGIYCMRFLRPIISIERINVSIEIIPQGLHKKIPPIYYELVENGYPEIKYDIYKLTGDQLRANGGMWTGELLKNYITDKLENAG